LIWIQLEKAMHYSDKIREFVITDFLFGDGASLKDDTSFLETGIVDSTGILELITFLEQTFGIKVNPEEALPENLDSVAKAAAFVQRKLAAQPETCSSM